MTAAVVSRTIDRMQPATSEHKRITLQIRAVVEPYRDRLVRNDSKVRTGYRRRARRLLDRLDSAVLPFPDLAASLSAARVELELA
jgi:hypothetical protein